MSGISALKKYPHSFLFLAFSRSEISSSVFFEVARFSLLPTHPRDLSYERGLRHNESLLKSCIIKTLDRLSGIVRSACLTL